MLSKPLDGWTDFQLEGTSAYSLSYLDNVPFDWLDRAIIGLTYKATFCVKGELEPGKLCCTVSVDGCRIEAEGNTEYHICELKSKQAYCDAELRSPSPVVTKSVERVRRVSGGLGRESQLSLVS